MFTRKNINLLSIPLRINQLDITDVINSVIYITLSIPLRINKLEEVFEWDGIYLLSIPLRINDALGKRSYLKPLLYFQFH